MTEPTPDPSMREMLHDAVDTSADVNRRLGALESRVTNVEKGVEKVEKGVAENTKLTTGIAEGTTELLDLFKSVKGGFKVMGWLGHFAKWIAGIAAAIAAIYAYVQSLRGH